MAFEPNWDNIFKNVPNKYCGRQPLKSFLFGFNLSLEFKFVFLKVVFHKFYLVYSGIDCLICPSFGCCQGIADITGGIRSD